MGVYPGSMSVEDRDLRRRLRISSVAAPPPPSPLNGRTFMLEEILIYYPFLRLSDGTYKTNYANAIHANLQSDWDFRQSYATNGITFDEIRKLPGDPVNRDLIPIINERSELFWEARGMEPIDPKTVAAPSSSFLSVLPRADQLTYRQFRGIVAQLDNANRSKKQGFREMLVRNARERLQGYGIHTSEEQLRQLMQMPLEELVVVRMPDAGQ